MSEIVNRQRKIKINYEEFYPFVERAIALVAKDKDVTIAFISDNKMRELNRDFRNNNKTTDVLSFPYESDGFETEENYLGDVIISLEQAQRQAAENHLTFETEVKQLILHGIIHLCGYDHETDSGEMNELELKLRQKLKV